ncbi:hypothetical protein H5410_062550 [Solanum commersonii]|uniref:Putative plant transposon protein domain-containing protein n=1 Tax=Solanum commersonii TaxID=4109 RepID=A0A9J5WCN4_SOLCO|nr:hypothetical protein H5410_062550 [Solanum commersonii]
MWWVLSRVGRVKLSGTLVAENRCKNLVKMMCKGMAGNGLNVKRKLIREFYANWLTETKYKTVPVRGKDVKFSARILNEFLGTMNYDANEFSSLKDKPLYRDIRHTLCGVESTATWERSCPSVVEIVCSLLLPAKHLTKVTRDMVALVYMLMKGMPINVGAILRQNMMKFRRLRVLKKKQWTMIVAYHPDLTGKIVDVTRTKALDTSLGPILSSQERQARDDSIMARMFGMAELSGPAFLELLDDDEATADEVMDEEDDVDAVNDEVG